ncbi:MAG: hypothetical protein RL391_962 [Actinomycetota bacterium]|jgi:electron transfer flavoprotein beta subunit
MIAVCLKWVQPHGASDDRFAGISAADQSALELTLRTAEARGDEVVAITAGPIGAERALRDALACGAARAVRIDTEAGTSSSSIASALAREVATADIVWCGDYSVDRGTGSVPAFLAARLGVDQALGLIDVEINGNGSQIRAIRRLDGGRREILSVNGRAVLSVEGSTARLRRAALRSVIAADSASIEVRPSEFGGVAEPELVPYRPRARVLPAPAGQSALDRVRMLTDAGGTPSRTETVVLDPPAAARRILDTLREWGYLT